MAANHGNILTDTELFRQIAAGSESAFAQLFSGYRRRLFTYIFKLSESEVLAEDLVQDIFLKVWTSRKTLGEITNASAFLHKMAHNRSIDAFRRHATESLMLTEIRRTDFTETIDTSEQQLVAREVRDYIEGLVLALTPQQRQVFRMSREQGMQQKEIAASLGISITTVKTHMSDALRILREQLIRRYGPSTIGLFVIWQLLHD